MLFYFKMLIQKPLGYFLAENGRHFSEVHLHQSCMQAENMFWFIFFYKTIKEWNEVLPIRIIFKIKTNEKLFNDHCLEWNSFRFVSFREALMPTTYRLYKMCWKFLKLKKKLFAISCINVFFDTSCIKVFKEYVALMFFDSIY